MLFSPKIVRCYCNYLKKYSSNDLHVRMIHYNNFRSRWGGHFSIYMYIFPETVQNLCNDEDYRVDNKSSLKKSKLYDTMAITKMVCQIIHLCSLTQMFDHLIWFDFFYWLMPAIVMIYTGFQDRTNIFFPDLRSQFVQSDVVSFRYVKTSAWVWILKTLEPTYDAWVWNLNHLSDVFISCAFKLVIYFGNI